MFKYVMFFVAVVILSFAGFVAYHVGALKPVQIAQENRGELHLIYKVHTGPYHKTVKTIEEIENWAMENKVDCHLTFGEYLDDPEKTEEARLKSYGGCVVDRFPENLPADFKTLIHPARAYVVAVFDGSPGIGPLKVYPRVNEFMQERKLKQNAPVIEVYEIHSRTETASMTTTYLFPVDEAAGAETKQ